MFIYYMGDNLGKAIKAFLEHRPHYIELIETITKEPIQEWEKP